MPNDLRKRMVIGYVSDALGVPVTDAQLKFVPTEPIGGTSDTVVVNREFTAQTDEEGYFEIDLWCDEDSLVSIDYEVTFPTQDDGQPTSELHKKTFSLNYGDGDPIDIGVLIFTGIPVITPEELLNQQVEAIVNSTIANSLIGLGLNADSGSVLFVNGDNELGEDNNRFFYNDTTGALKLVDKNYIPYANALNADNLFSVGSNDNDQDVAGVITTSNHFVGGAFDLKITASGANKFYRGLLTQFRVGGSYTGTPFITGHSVQVNNRLNTTATPYIYAIEGSINVEGPFTEAIGMQAIAYRGSTVTGDTIGGLRAIGANGYSTAVNVFGVDALVKTVSAGATIQNGQSVWARIQLGAGHTILTASGLKVGNWTNSGYIETSFGIFIDSTIDVGDTKYCIYSESTSLSLFSGFIQVPNALRTAMSGWANDFTVPTKDAVDQITNIDRQVTLFNDCLFTAGTEQDIEVSQSAAGMWNITFPTTHSYSGYGFCKLNLRTGATNKAWVASQSNSSTDLMAYRIGQGEVSVYSRFAIETLSDGTNSYTLRVGHSDRNQTEGVNGCYFRYTHSVNGGRWQAVCRQASTETAVDTGITPNTGVIHKYEVRAMADGSGVYFFIDGSQAAFIATNIPTASNQPVGGGFFCEKTAGTTDNVIAVTIDYVKIVLTFAATR